jgi:hypothetical protein
MLIALALLLVGLGAQASSAGASTDPAYVPAPAPEPPDTVSGWVVDANDWLDRGFLGVRHEQTALTNASLGIPLVILTRQGTIVYPVNQTAPLGPMMDNVRLMQFAEHRVVVTGNRIGRDDVQGMVIDNVVEAPGTERAPAFPSRETAGVRIIARVRDLSFWLDGCDSCSADRAHLAARAADGEPLVLVTDSGKMYYPVVRATTTSPPDFTTLLDHFEQMVVATGTIIHRGRARAIAIDSLVAYTPVETIQERSRQ